MEAKIKHLELIQGVINRLAANSFQIKGWTVILVSALLALLAQEGRIKLAYIGFIPVLVFWGLDGYFLWQERLFRDLYNQIRVMDESEINFSMVTGAGKRTWFGAMLSTTLLIFYMALSLLVLVVVAM
ncbi:MAG: hypothetical protein ERJ69_08185 [Aphanocapsa feldmannii 288cV]|nr:MAG: hypothetical protein ERJ69_08185 [Aphanocapsa feldmannii 288cV]